MGRCVHLTGKTMACKMRFPLYGEVLQRRGRYECSYCSNEISVSGRKKRKKQKYGQDFSFLFTIFMIFCI